MASADRRVIVVAAALLAAPSARADLAQIVNDIRATGCDGEVPAPTRLQSAAALDAAAGLVARGADVGAALERSGFRSTSTKLINIGGVADDAAIREVLADGFCADVADRSLTTIGAYVRGKEFWLLLAVDARSYGASATRAEAERVLALVNEARAKPRRCGGRRFDAAPPLTASAPLARAAAAHAADMAAHGFMGHEGSDGRNAGERVRRAGYRWRAVGENVAAGQADAETVVRSWLDSPGHCANLMSPQFTEMGVAFELAPESELRILWAQVFAAPR